MMDDLVKRLRETLARMASRCRVPMDLWQDHSVAVLKAADRIEADAKRIEGLINAANQARLALAGYVSAQSAINMLDAALEGEK